MYLFKLSYASHFIIIIINLMYSGLESNPTHANTNPYSQSKPSQPKKAGMPKEYSDCYSAWRQLFLILREISGSNQWSSSTVLLRSTSRWTSKMFRAIPYPSECILLFYTEFCCKHIRMINLEYMLEEH